MKRLLSAVHTLLLATLVAGCSGASSAPAPAATERSVGEPMGDPDSRHISVEERSLPYVKIEEAALEPEHAAIRAPARVAFRDGAVSTVGAPAPGRIVKLMVEAGERVEANAPLVVIASPEASEYAMDLARARIEVDAANDAVKRQEDMATKGVGREVERIAAKHRLAEAKAALVHAQKTVNMLGPNSGGMVTVTAPIEGTILRRLTTVGAQVEPGGDPLFEIGNPEALWVVAEVFQDDLLLVREGAKVTLEFAARPGAVIGHVVGIGVLVDTGLRRAPVYVAIDEAISGLTPGAYARASILAPAEQGVTLPKTAVLIKDGTHSVVYVEESPGKFAQRDVVLGHTFGEHVQVISGIKPGERIAVAGALLIDGEAQQLL
ncbi:efflux RND transporter periplasmic adaptor subunit [Nannocystis sp. ILAH1]|uniref:efflux RND transporter periplasmic adaptor subunit n=1 Tax=unclassified Nannocystis TaxID=2627009 RepID=UPI002270FDFB|nr:efflux RND transporter periplasmic adaptor subunit [Nannocystis sp. ILAH1]MCY1071622.1 efflux RND transporter periplasmic adaptor subunit [Nannocystis sp. RBIL2]